MTYWRCHYHIIWTTLNRTPVLTPEREGVVARCITSVTDEKGLILHGFGLVEDHVHLVLSIPPKFAVSDIVKTIKGSSSHQLRGVIDESGLTWPGWQGEYGVLTFGDQSFDRIVAYVRNQVQHHAEGSIWPTLERIEREGISE